MTNEEQKKILIYKFLNRFNDLEKVIKDDWTFYVDKNRKPLFFHSHGKKNEYISFNYDRIWSFFKEFFLMEDQEIQGILKDWLEETYKLKGFTPAPDSLSWLYRLEETYKLLRGFMR